VSNAFPTDTDTALGKQIRDISRARDEPVAGQTSWALVWRGTRTPVRRGMETGIFIPSSNHPTSKNNLTIPLEKQFSAKPQLAKTQLVQSIALPA